jgi:hypothetical protein
VGRGAVLVSVAAALMAAAAPASASAARAPVGLGAPRSAVVASLGAPASEAAGHGAVGDLTRLAYPRRRLVVELAGGRVAGLVAGGPGLSADGVRVGMGEDRARAFLHAVAVCTGARCAWLAAEGAAEMRIAGGTVARLSLRAAGVVRPGAAATIAGTTGPAAGFRVLVPGRAFPDGAVVTLRRGAGAEPDVPASGVPVEVATSARPRLPLRVVIPFPRARVPAGTPVSLLALDGPRRAWRVLPSRLSPRAGTVAADVRSPGELTWALTSSAPAIVALGDSFASGEADFPYDAGTDVLAPGGTRLDGCHRSGDSWPRLLGVTRSRHLACSGARIADLTRGQERLAPDSVAQLARLEAIARRTPPAAVVVTVGGNDLGFVPIVEQCFLGTCLDQVGTVETPVLQALHAPLVAAYRAIARAAPGARVVVVGYPDLFPPPGAPSAGCPWLDQGERAGLATLAAHLDAVLRAAAAEAGVEYVSLHADPATGTASAVAGHEICTRGSWFFPVDPARFGRDQQQGHPLAPAQRAIALRVAAALARPPAAS